MAFYTSLVIYVTGATESFCELPRSENQNLRHFRQGRRNRLRETMSTQLDLPSYRHNENDCFVSCCCSTFCCLGCCYTIKKSTRIKITWAWLILLGIASSVVLSCYLYKPDYPYTSPSDMRPVTNNINFLFCEAVSIDSTGISMDAYSVTGPLTIDPEAREVVTYRTALYSDIYDFNFFTLYLLPGTTMKLRHCVKEIVAFYVFSGMSNFEQWKKDQYCEFCYDTKIFLGTVSDCNSDDNYEEFNLNVTNSGEMVFVYANKDFNAAWVNLKLNLNRTLYDLSHADPVCTDVLECDVSIDGPGITVVYHVDDGYDIGEANHPKFTTKCVPRVWAYFMIHGLAILLIGITCSLLIQRLCKETRDPYAAYRYAGFEGNERTPLLYDHAALPPSYSSVTLSPPKYEDIIRDCGSPPPYLAAVAALNEGHYGRVSVNTEVPNTVHERAESVSGTNGETTPNAAPGLNDVRVRTDDNVDSQVTAVEPPSPLNSVNRNVST